MKRLVVGVDGSAASEMAIHWASALASATGAGVTVAHVGDYADRDGLRGGLLAHGARAARVEALDTARIGHDLRFLHGDPPTRILDLALEVGADMIVIGRRGHIPLAPRLLGSFTRRLLQTNEIPVAIVPAPSEQASLAARSSTAVVGLDGTASSQSVLAFAVSFGEALCYDIHALTVVDIHGDSAATGTRSGPIVGSAECALRQLVNAIDPQRPRSIAARVELGVAADELLRSSRHAEVLVVGHRRSTPTGRFLTHATSRYCAAHASCPVVLVPIEPAVDRSRRPSVNHEPQRSRRGFAYSLDHQTPTGEEAGARHG